MRKMKGDFKEKRKPDTTRRIRWWLLPFGPDRATIEHPPAPTSQTLYIEKIFKYQVFQNLYFLTMILTCAPTLHDVPQDDNHFH